jgi:hypothetical protein
MLTAERLMLIGGLTSFLLTVHWVRRRDLREKYAVGWVLVACVLLLTGLFPGVIMSLADAAHLSYPAAVLFVALAVVYVFSLGVSVSLTRQYRRNVRLTQEVAMLERRIRLLEEEAYRRGAAGAANAEGQLGGLTRTNPEPVAKASAPGRDWR